MKFYVAAKFSDKEQVKDAYALIKAAGHAITHEWIHHKDSYPFENDPAYAAQCATDDINGVLAADIFVVLSNAEPSMGASAELGAAIASFLKFKTPHIFVVGPHFDTNFAYWHPAVVQKDSVEAVLMYFEGQDANIIASYKENSMRQ